jgi:hypothetical protein
MQLTIHVGLSKAASTYLQELFFPGLRDAAFIHAPYLPPPDPNPIQRFVRALLFRNVACLDLPAIRTEIAEHLQSLNREHVIVSSEALFGTPFQNHSDFRLITDVLAEVFDAPQIWLVVRRQDAWLESTYSQFLKMGLSTSPERFTNFRDGQFGDYRWVYGGANLDVRDLDWCCYVDYYRRTFGEANVLVQPYEAFVRERESFLARFCAFAGVTPFVPEAAEAVNPSLSPISATVARLANALPMPMKLGLKRWIPTRMHPALILNRTLDPLLKRRRLFPAELSRAALALHDENNRRLQAMIGQDLETYGYY